MLALAAYYAWIFSLGSRPSDVGKTNLLNLGFAFYELSGMQGLGPGRLVIRGQGIKAFLPWLPLIGKYLGFGLVAWGLVLKGHLRDLWEKTRIIIAFLLSALVPTVFILLLGWIMGFRVVGRHLTPLEPMIVFMLAWVLVQLWETQAWRRRLVAVLVFFMVLSCVNFRFLPQPC